ncbi:MAG: DoxX family membrane protein [Steroidobacteraceae bacterium]
MLGLVYGDFAPILEPFPASLPWREVWAYGSAAILLAASVGLFFARTALVGAIIIGLYASVWAVARARVILLKPLILGTWYGFGEALGPLIGAWILYAVLRRRYDAPALTVMTGDRALHVARVLFGAACVVYGAAHFGYAAFTATMVPAWLPGRTGLAYLTGVGHAAAGFGLLLGILPRLAATLEAIMMSLFGVLVWLPSFFAQPAPQWAPSRQIQWSETFLSFLLAASAWIVAASLRSTSWSFAPTVPGDSAAPVK